MDGEELALPRYTTDAIHNLRTQQRQLDADGCIVGVSREALEVALAELDRAALSASPAGRWLPASEQPIGGWYVTWREGEDGLNITQRIQDDEWSDGDGATTVTHSTLLPPTHYHPGEMIGVLRMHCQQAIRQTIGARDDQYERGFLACREAAVKAVDFNTKLNGAMVNKCAPDATMKQREAYRQAAVSFSQCAAEVAYLTPQETT